MRKFQLELIWRLFVGRQMEPDSRDHGRSSAGYIERKPNGNFYHKRLHFIRSGLYGRGYSHGFGECNYRYRNKETTHKPGVNTSNPLFLAEEGQQATAISAL